MSANTKYKDSVFSSLFSKPDTLRELYSVLQGVDLPPDIPISVNTLQDVIFMGRINDVHKNKSWSFTPLRTPPIFVTGREGVKLQAAR